MIISCIGDSLTEGDYGIFGKTCIANIHKENYPYFLAKSTGAEVRNFGKCGAKSKTIYERYCEGLIDVTGSDIIIIMLGTNGGHSLDEETECNIDYVKIIEKCKEQAPEADIVICTPPHVTVDPNMSGVGCYEEQQIAAKFVRRVSKKYNLPLIDVDRCDRFTDETEKVYQANDGVHFVEEGYKALAEYFEEELRKLFPNRF